MSYMLTTTFALPALIVSFLLPINSSLALTRYVVADNPGALAPFTNWPKASSNIQAAVDASTSGDIVLVSNGVYRGQTVRITNGIAVRSVNGPQVTTVDGQNVMRGFYISHSNAVVEGFTITKGHSEGEGGGGVYMVAGLVDRCIVNWNYVVGGTGFDGAPMGSNGGPGEGGGIYCRGGMIRNCLVHDNIAKGGTGGYGDDYQDWEGNWWYGQGGPGGFGEGGGICQPGWGNSVEIVNCTVVNNQAVGGDGGGGYYVGNPGTGYAGGIDGGGKTVGANNIVYFNVGDTQAEANVSMLTSSYSCITPNPGGQGNITNDPGFVSSTDWRLGADSPCINTGTNRQWMTGAVALDGSPRIYGEGRVDIGAYEYQASISIIPTNWLARFGLPIDGSADYAHSDGDRFNNWEEYISDYDPTNSSSFFSPLEILRDNDKINFKFEETSPNRFFYIEETFWLTNPTNNALPPPWHEIFRHQGVGEMNVEYDLPEDASGFYRGKVKLN